MNAPAEPTEPLPSGKNPRQIPDVYKVIAVYVVVMLILLVAFVLPSGRVTAAKSSCPAILKQIDGAIQQWALENNKAATNAVDLTEAMKYLKGGVLPTCPEGGVYSAGASVDHRPVCSLQATLGHSLP